MREAGEKRRREGSWWVFFSILLLLDFFSLEMAVRQKERVKEDARFTKTLMKKRKKKHGKDIENHPFIRLTESKIITNRHAQESRHGDHGSANQRVGRSISLFD